MIRFLCVVLFFLLLSLACADDAQANFLCGHLETSLNAFSEADPLELAFSSWHEDFNDFMADSWRAYEIFGRLEILSQGVWPAVLPTFEMAEMRVGPQIFVNLIYPHEPGYQCLFLENPPLLEGGLALSP